MKRIVEKKSKAGKNGRIFTGEAKQRTRYLLPSDKFCIDFCIFKKGQANLACDVVIPTFQLPQPPEKFLKQPC